MLGIINGHTPVAERILLGAGLSREEVQATFAQAEEFALGLLR